MSELAVVYANAVIDYLRGAGAPSAISGIYLDLYNGDPQGAGVSVLGTITGSSTRLNVTAAFGAASGGVSTNTSTVSVTTSAVGAAPVSHVAFFGASMAGTLIMSNALTVPRSVSIGNNVLFNVSSLRLTLSS